MYVELIVLIDLFMNYLIIISTSIILNRLTNYKKIFLSSTIGCIPLIFIYIPITNYLLIIINILISFIMSIISFSYRNLLYTTKNTIYMYFVSIFLAGSTYLINTHIFPNIKTTTFSLIIIFILLPIITSFFIKNIKEIKKISSNYYKTYIYIKDEPKINLIAYLDTGNTLFDPYTHKPIILISKKIINHEPNKYIFVPYNTIDNHNLLKCFKPEKVYIEKVGYLKNILIGLIDNVNIDGADGILPSIILERVIT